VCNFGNCNIICEEQWHSAVVGYPSVLLLCKQHKLCLFSFTYYTIDYTYIYSICLTGISDVLNNCSNIFVTGNVKIIM